MAVKHIPGDEADPRRLLVVTDVDWLQAVDDLLAASKTAGAPHRPVLLLFLLGRVQRGEEREVSYEIVERGITAVLEETGSAKKPEPLLPFWHLQTSPFWEVLDADALPRRKGKDRPTRRVLIDAKSRGAVREAWWAALQGNQTLISALGERLLTSLWADTVVRERVAQLVGFTV